jgi:hypothetical protein
MAHTQTPRLSAFQQQSQEVVTRVLTKATRTVVTTVLVQAARSAASQVPRRVAVVRMAVTGHILSPLPPRLRLVSALL